MIRNWLSVLIREVLSGRQLRRASRQALRRRGRLRLELLEDREVPSVASTTPPILYNVYLPAFSSSVSSGTDGAASGGSAYYYHFAIESNGGSTAGLERILEDLNNLTVSSSSPSTSLPTISVPPPPAATDSSEPSPPTSPLPPPPPAPSSSSTTITDFGTEPAANGDDVEVPIESGFTVVSADILIAPSWFPVSEIYVNSGIGSGDSLGASTFTTNAATVAPVTPGTVMITATFGAGYDAIVTSVNLEDSPSGPLGTTVSGESNSPPVATTSTPGTTRGDDVSPFTLGPDRGDDVSTPTPAPTFFSSALVVGSPFPAPGQAGPGDFGPSSFGWGTQPAPYPFQPLTLAPNGVSPSPDTDQAEPVTFPAAPPGGGEAPSVLNPSPPETVSSAVSGPVFLSQTPLVIANPQGRKVSGSWSESASIPRAFGEVSSSQPIPQFRSTDGVSPSAQSTSSRSPAWTSPAGPRSPRVGTVDRPDSSHEIHQTLAELPDGTLLRRFVTGGEQAAFTELVLRHERAVLAIGMKVLGDLHSAQDVFQATILVLARRAGLLDGRTPLGGWLAKVAYHLALRHRIASERRRLLEQNAATGKSLQISNEFTTDLEQEELRHALREELQKLPEKYRVPLVRCYFDGRTHAEVAQEIGLPRGSIAKRIGEGLERLRDRLLDRGFLL
jgi:RNA polymerase sigma factor (sigma-70 family)